MSRWAVIGAKGMLGQAVVADATPRAACASVDALDIDEVDITDPASIRACAPLQQAAVIVNCAAYTDVERAEDEEDRATRINGDGVALLAALAETTGARLVHVSTDFVFDGARETPYPPDTPRCPLSAYGRSKAKGEEALEASDAKWTLVRTAWLYGPGGKNFVETMLHLAETKGELHVVCDQVGSPTYAPDLATALLDLAERDAGGVFHCTNAGAASWHQFACEIVKQSGLHVPVHPITADEAAQRFHLKATRPRYSVLDRAGLESTLGRFMRLWDDALADYLRERA